MRFDTTASPPALSDEVLVGNVYPAKGGQPTKFWIVAAVRGNSVHLIGILANGTVCSTTSYGTHTMLSRPVLGTCKALIDLDLTIEWVEEI